MFNRTALVRAIAVIVAGALLIVAAVRIGAAGKREGAPAVPASALGDGEHARCHDLGVDAERDAACKAMWARDRARFIDGAARERRP